MNDKTKKALNIVSYVLIGLVFLIALVVLMYSLSRKEKREMPKIFGASVLSVQSNSMKKTAESDPDFAKVNFKKGDLIIVKQLKTAKAKQAADLKIGDVVTYYDGKINDFNTHTIIHVREESGVITYVTRGIGLKVEGTGASAKSVQISQAPADESGKYADSDIIGLSDVVAVYKGKMAGMGATLDFFKGKLGFGLLVVLPLFVFLAYRIFVVVKLLIAINKEKKGVTTVSEMEQMQAEIEKLRAQIASGTEGNKPPEGGTEN